MPLRPQWPLSSLLLACLLLALVQAVEQADAGILFLDKSPTAQLDNYLRKATSSSELADNMGPILNLIRKGKSNAGGAEPLAAAAETFARLRDIRADKCEPQNSEALDAAREQLMRDYGDRFYLDGAARSRRPAQLYNVALLTHQRACLDKYQRELTREPQLGERTGCNRPWPGCLR